MSKSGNKGDFCIVRLGGTGRICRNEACPEGFGAICEAHIQDIRNGERLTPAKSVRSKLRLGFDRAVRSVRAEKKSSTETTTCAAAIDNGSDARCGAEPSDAGFGVICKNHVEKLQAGAPVVAAAELDPDQRDQFGQAAATLRRGWRRFWPIHAATTPGGLSLAALILAPLLYVSEVLEANTLGVPLSLLSLNADTAVLLLERLPEIFVTFLVVAFLLIILTSALVLLPITAFAALGAVLLGLIYFPIKVLILGAKYVALSLLWSLAATVDMIAARFGRRFSGGSGLAAAPADRLGKLGGEFRVKETAFLLSLQERASKAAAIVVPTARNFVTKLPLSLFGRYTARRRTGFFRAGFVISVLAAVLWLSWMGDRERMARIAAIAEITPQNGESYTSWSYQCGLHDGLVNDALCQYLGFLSGPLEVGHAVISTRAHGSLSFINRAPEPETLEPWPKAVSRKVIYIGDYGDWTVLSLLRNGGADLASDRDFMSAYAPDAAYFQSQILDEPVGGASRRGVQSNDLIFVRRNQIVEFRREYQPPPATTNEVVVDKGDAVKAPCALDDGCARADAVLAARIDRLDQRENARHAQILMERRFGLSEGESPPFDFEPLRLRVLGLAQALEDLRAIRDSDASRIDDLQRWRGETQPRLVGGERSFGARIASLEAERALLARKEDVRVALESVKAALGEKANIEDLAQLKAALGAVATMLESRASHRDLDQLRRETLTVLERHEGDAEAHHAAHPTLAEIVDLLSAIEVSVAPAIMAELTPSSELREMFERLVNVKGDPSAKGVSEQFGEALDDGVYSRARVVSDAIRQMPRKDQSIYRKCLASTGGAAAPRWRVYFGKGQSTPLEGGEATIAAAAAAIQAALGEPTVGETIGSKVISVAAAVEGERTARRTAPMPLIFVRGWASASGPATYNLELSEDRAEEAARLLRSRLDKFGLPAARYLIAPFGGGETLPLHGGGGAPDDQDGRAQSAEIVLCMAPVHKVEGRPDEADAG